MPFNKHNNRYTAAGLILSKPMELPSTMYDQYFSYFLLKVFEQVTLLEFSSAPGSLNLLSASLNSSNNTENKLLRTQD